MSSPESYAAELDEAVSFLKQRLPFIPETLVILGSGLGNAIEGITNTCIIPFKDIPHFPVSTVAGHSGQLLCGEVKGRTVAFMQGRVHLYEGYPASKVVFGVRAFALLGTRVLFVTNSCGALNPSFEVGSFMLLTNHISFFCDDPSIGVYSPKLGELFYDQYRPYDKGLGIKAHEAATQQQLILNEGTYFFYRNCSYETAAEVEMMKRLGADAVGKSTVPEVLAAKQAGMQVLGIGCISSNMSTPAAETPLTHEQVLEEGRRMERNFARLISATLSII